MNTSMKVRNTLLITIGLLLALSISGCGGGSMSNSTSQGVSGVDGFGQSNPAQGPANNNSTKGKPMISDGGSK